MKITKLVHSCLLVETPERVALLDPGNMSTQMIEAANIERLDDIIVTHKHADHMDTPTIQQLKQRFPGLRITAPVDAREELAQAGLEAFGDETDQIKFFDSPHESVEPLFPKPDELGVHYLAKLSHPGDSHSFSETKDILALPVSAPWGATIRAVNLGLELKPKYIIPIHDWHWSDEARAGMYQMMGKVFADAGIKFISPTNGQAFEVDV